MQANPAPLTLNPETLGGIDVFRHLPVGDRKDICAHCGIQRYTPDQPIISYHDNNREVFFLVSGKVRATIYSMSGRQVTLQDLPAGQMFGELAAIDGKPRSAHVVANTECVIVTMKADVFLRMLEEHPSVMHATLVRLTDMVRHLCDRVFEVCALPVKDRIRAELLRLAIQSGTRENIAVISPAPTHADIASHIGTHREAVTRELVNLKTAGLVSRQKGSLIVNDVGQLSRIVHDVTGN
jgi:CRP-like cAMP-binding protein